jgi:hypothetical protein
MLDTKTLDERLRLLLLDKNSKLLLTLSNLLRKEENLKELDKEEEGKKERIRLVKKSASKLHQPYINNVKVSCALCGTTHNSFLVMAWCYEERCFKASYGLLNVPIPPTLKVHNVNLIADSCESCPSLLLNHSKEWLISHLMDRVKRDNLYYEKRVEIMRENNNKEVL